MIEILWSDTFNRWLTKLKDRQAAARVLGPAELAELDAIGGP